MVVRFAVLALAVVAAACPARAEVPTTRPSLVDLRIDVQRPTDAAVALGDSIGTYVYTHSRTDRPIRFESFGQPLVPTLCAFFRHNGFTPGENNGVYLREGAPLATAAVGDTAAILAVGGRVAATVGVFPRKPPERRCVYDLHLSLITDPALKIGWVANEAHLDAFVQDGITGQPTRSTTGSKMRPGGLVWPLSSQFTTSAPISNLKNFRGHVRVRQVVEEVSLNVDYDPRTESRAGDDGPLTARVFAGGGANQSHGITVVLGRPALQGYVNGEPLQFLAGCVSMRDADGRAVPATISDVRPDEDKAGVRMWVVPQDHGGTRVAAGTHRVQVRVPTKTRPIDIAFELADVPLP